MRGVMVSITWSGQAVHLHRRKARSYASARPAFSQTLVLEARREAALQVMDAFTVSSARDLICVSAA